MIALVYHFGSALKPPIADSDLVATMTVHRLRTKLAPEDITVRPCSTFGELERCVAIQEEVWRFEAKDLVPASIFIIAHKTGGQVLAAFHDSQQIGFVLALAALRQGRAYLHSHMTAILPSHQGCGVGRLLKLSQREEALSRQIDLIEWTFDPLALQNARFNIEYLGAIARQYVPNQYGCTSSPLHGGIATDRLVAEWRLNSVRVCETLRGQKQRQPKDSVRLSVPTSLTELLRKRASEAASMQLRVRKEFQEWFSKGYAITGFELSGDQARYQLEPFQGIVVGIGKS